MCESASVMNIVLASASPRRQDLLGLLGAPLRVVVPDADESILANEPPEALVKRLSQIKAEAALQRLRADLLTTREAAPACIIAADTIVVAPEPDPEILGKPRDGAEAAQMLRRLRNRKHLVYTGLAMQGPHSTQRAIWAVATPVLMRDYSEAQIASYVASGDPLDKAGAYAIQHPRFAPVDHLEGCYANVMGLPLCHVYRTLIRWGMSPLLHPLQTCPYPLAHEGQCPWAASILEAEQ